MKSMGAATRKLAVCGALCAAFGAAQAATPDECRQDTGFPLFSQNYDTGVWGAVTRNGEAFKGRPTVTSCVVDYPVQDGGKGKPVTQPFTVPVDGEMAKDQCSAFSILVAIDSKIFFMKFQDAYNKASDLAAKLASLRDADKLTYEGYAAIVGGEAGVDNLVTCLNDLLTQ